MKSISLTFQQIALGFLIRLWQNSIIAQSGQIDKSHSCETMFDSMIIIKYNLCNIFFVNFRFNNNVKR